MATLKEIKTSISNVTRYQNAEGTIPRLAVDLIEHIATNVRKVLQVEPNEDVIRLARPDAKSAVGRPVGEHFLFHDSGYRAELIFAVDGLAVQVEIRLAPTPELGQDASQIQRWTLHTPKKAFGLGIDPKVANLDEACLAITDVAKERFEEKAKALLGGGRAARAPGNDEDRLRDYRG